MSNYDLIQRRLLTLAATGKSILVTFVSSFPPKEAERGVEETEGSRKKGRRKRKEAVGGRKLKCSLKSAAFGLTKTMPKSKQREEEKEHAEKEQQG